MWRGAERAVEWLDRGETVSAGPAAAAKEQTSGSGSAVLPATYQLKAFIFAQGDVLLPRSANAMDVDGNEGWLLFNEKVVVADGRSVGESKKLAYMDVFEKAKATHWALYSRCEDVKRGDTK